MNKLQPNEMPELSNQELEDISGGMYLAYEDDKKRDESYTAESIEQKINDVMADKLISPIEQNQPSYFEGNQ